MTAVGVSLTLVRYTPIFCRPYTAVPIGNPVPTAAEPNFHLGSISLFRFARTRTLPLDLGMDRAIPKRSGQPHRRLAIAEPASECQLLAKESHAKHGDEYDAELVDWGPPGLRRRVEEPGNSRATRPRSPSPTAQGISKCG